ncbi:MAG: ROK family protein [Actinomycetaceae bacterium]|nr:ROK family protein [Actinomycetaceae bacterium]
MGAKTDGPLTLTIDCGGGGIKSNVLDRRGTALGTSHRTPTPYPLPPTLLVDIVKDLASKHPSADRITLGMPGMIRHGIVIETPHYVCRSGPRTRLAPGLVEQWANFPMARVLSEELELPALVLNDAEVAGYGAITGTGTEMIITLGTGLGNAIFDGGRLAPHLELSRLPVKWGLSFDDYLGEHERLRLGESHWSRRVRRIVESLKLVVQWDRLFIGGGNSSHITARARAGLGSEIVIVPNDAGVLGGVRAWEFQK